jgi:predicted permease
LTDFGDGGDVRMWGRLRAGFAPKAAEQELKSLAAELRKAHPEGIWEKENLPSDPGGYAKSLMIGNRSGTGSEAQDELYPVFAMVAALGLLILAVACANLGSLLLARGVAREREIAIRVAVGAGRSRLLRQLFTESLVLALLGSMAGWALGWAVLRSLLILTDVPTWLNTAPDWRVTVFAVGAGFASAILFGLTPAMQAARQRHRATIARQILVGAQVAASCVLLIVAGLLSRALNHAMSSNPGFDYQQVISIDPGLAAHGYSPARARAYLDTLQERLRGLPGVQSVALAESPPLGRRTEMAGLNIDGRAFRIQINRVDPQFFQTMHVPLLRGRNLLSGEKHAVVVSESLARGVLPGQDPLGKKFVMDADDTIVGIAGSARLVRLEDSDSVEIYLPIAPEDLPGTSVLVRTSGAPEDVARSVASTAKAVDPNTFPEVQLIKAAFRQKLRGAETSALAVSVLGSIADLLACLGIVGVVAYAVSQRTREIGVRMALGARPAHILAVVLRQFSRPVAAGLLVGVGGAAALSGLLRGQLYGISNLDPMAYLGAIGMFAMTVAGAALWPARRALRVDPMRALRHE